MISDSGPNFALTKNISINLFKHKNMKKLLVFIMALMPATMAMAMTDNDRPIGFEELPAKAKQFIAEHFPDAKVALATVESPNWSPTYEVIFTDGMKMEFIASGEWKEIDCKYSKVPEGVIPAKIREFLKTHHVDNFVRDIERSKRKYELKLDNGLELRFDINGEFRGYDD